MPLTLIILGSSLSILSIIVFKIAEASAGVNDMTIVCLAPLPSKIPKEGFT